MVNSSDSDQIVGQVTCYSYDWHRKYKSNEESIYGEVIKGCCAIIGALFGMCLFWIMGLSDLGKPEPDETYIETIAIYKEYRGQKLSKEILKYAEHIALEQHNSSYLSLHVEVNNKIAINAYLKVGFEIDNRCCKTGYCCWCCGKNLYRMRKPIR